MQTFLLRRIRLILRLIKLEKKYLLSFSLMFLSLLIAYLYLLRPAIIRLKTIKVELATVYHQIAETRSLVAHYPNPDKSIKLLNEKYKIYSQMLPPKSFFLLTTQKLINILREEGIRVVNYKPIYDLKSQKKIKGIKEMGIELVLNCDFITLGKFLEKLEEENIIYTIEKFNFGKNESGKFTAYILLGLYSRS